MGGPYLFPQGRRNPESASAERSGIKCAAIHERLLELGMWALGSRQIPFNFALAASLAWKSLRHHRLISGATILGVATGMCVVCAILIVDQNTARTDICTKQLATTVTLHADEPGKQRGLSPKPRIVSATDNKSSNCQEEQSGSARNHVVNFQSSNAETANSSVSQGRSRSRRVRRTIKPCDWPSGWHPCSLSSSVP